MARLSVCAVYDSAVQLFNRPMFAPANGQIVRAFTDEVNREGADNTLWLHPEDYSLYQLAWFDEEFGKFEVLENPQNLCRGKDVKVR